jgi:hypothetical protein
MVTKIKRRKLSIDDVFSKPKYKNLFQLIFDFTVKYPTTKKLKFCHIRYALCKHHGLNLKNYPMKEQQIKNFFNFSSFKFYDYSKALNELDKDFNDGKIEKKLYEKLMNREKNSEKIWKNDWSFYVWIDDPTIDKFSTYQACMYALKHLKRLRLIKREKDKKGNDYYMITNFGYCCWQRKHLHQIIDSLPNSVRLLYKINDFLHNFYPGIPDKLL